MILDRLLAGSRYEPGPLDTDCLVWTRARFHKGYGMIRIDGRTCYVHRVAWTARYGEPPPETPCVLHRCDNPACWADQHLFLGTNADNVADRVAKGRSGSGHGHETHCPRGHPYEGHNVYVKNGSRECRACGNERALARYRRLRTDRIKTHPKEISP